MIKNILAASVAIGILTTGSVNVLAHAGSSDPLVIHACVFKGSKLVRILRPTVPRCRTTERPLHWAITGPVLVSDSNEQVIGTDSHRGTFIPTLSAFVSFKDDGEVTTDFLLFTTNDCTGDVFASAFGSSIVAPGAHTIRKYDTSYVISGDVTAVIAAESYMDNSGACNVASQVVPVVNTTPFDVLDLPFTVPVAMPLVLHN